MKRFKLGLRSNGDGLAPCGVEDPNGAYVAFEDYLELERQLKCAGGTENPVAHLWRESFLKRSQCLSM